MQLALREACDLDEPFLFRLFCSVQEPDFAFLGEAERRAILKMQYAASQRSVCTNWPEARQMIVTTEGQPIGRLSTVCRSDELHLVEIALLSEHRNQGIGSFLMEMLVREARDNHALRIRLNAYRLSRAVRFYLRLGFVLVNDDGAYLLMEKIV